MLMMKTKLIVVICLYVALFPSIETAPNTNDSYESDESDHDLDEYLDDLNNMAKGGIPLNDVFKLSRNGHLGTGSFSLTYKGTLLAGPYKNTMVAIKLTPKEYKKNAEKEYEMYTYLGAINNPSIEAYGIPSVYYYGQWNECYLIAITLLDTESDKICGPNGFNNIDILILFREFVRISKYMHSRGVRHYDIKWDNIMFRQHQSFIIDFNMASKMYERKKSLSFFSIEEHTTGKQHAKQDWARFFTMMCSFIEIKFNFEIADTYGRVSMYEISSNIIKAMETFERIEQSGLKRVFVEFAKHAFQTAIESSSMDARLKTRYAVSEETPFYDQLYKVITEEIENHSHDRPAVVSWLKGSKREMAVMNLKNHPIPKISSINDPFGMIEPIYPKVDFGYFSKNFSVGESSASKKKKYRN